MNNQVMSQRGKEDRGIRCRHCGCRQLPVVYTRANLRGAIQRRRKCQRCGERITTWERAVGG
jgi:transcriptional regulator NrdR family protein